MTMPKMDHDDNTTEKSTRESVSVKRKLFEAESPPRAASNASKCLSLCHGNHSPAKKCPLSPHEWLQTIVSPLPSGPSKLLDQILSLPGNNIVDKVIQRADIISSILFPSSDFGQLSVGRCLHKASFISDSSAEQMRIEALKLYYSILEAVCTSQCQIPNKEIFLCFLYNECFHRSMLACSAQLILAAHGGSRTLLPVVLERIGITTFDLFKVIESFIKLEESLPIKLKRHLISLAEKLLERTVWGKGSSLYNYLMVAKPELSTKIKQLGLQARPMPSLDSIAAASHISSGGSYLKSASSRHNQNTPQLERIKHVDKTVDFFFSKVEKLAALRIKGIADRLKDISPHTQEKIRFLFGKILSQKTFLLFNRHIDQIILCCFYAVAKDSQQHLTFSDIIKSYDRQPQCTPEVYRCVPVNQSSEKNGDDHIDVIQFYNEIFVPNEIASLINSYPAATSDQVHQPSKYYDSPTSTLQRLPDISPKQVLPSQNVYLSPLRPSKKLLLNSRMGKSYYAYIGESTEPDRSPSKDLEDINRALKRAPRLRRLFEAGNPGVRFISDAEVAESSFFC